MSSAKFIGARKWAELRASSGCGDRTSSDKSKTSAWAATTGRGAPPARAGRCERNVGRLEPLERLHKVERSSGTAEPKPSEPAVSHVPQEKRDGLPRPRTSTTAVLQSQLTACRSPACGPLRLQRREQGNLCAVGSPRPLPSARCGGRGGRGPPGKRLLLNTTVARSKKTSQNLRLHDDVPEDRDLGEELGVRGLLRDDEPVRLKQDRRGEHRRIQGTQDAP